LGSIKLKSLISEDKVVSKNDRKIKKQIQSNIDELGYLTNQIDDIKKKLIPLQKRYGELIDVVLPVIEELDEETIKTQNYIFRIIKKGYERKSFKYKEGFLKSLSKVNQNTRKILEQILDETKKMVQVKPKFMVSPVEDIIPKKMIQWMKKFKKRIQSLFKYVSVIKQGNTELRKLI